MNDLWRHSSKATPDAFDAMWTALERRCELHIRGLMDGVRQRYKRHDPEAVAWFAQLNGACSDGVPLAAVASWE